MRFFRKLTVIAFAALILFSACQSEPEKEASFEGKDHIVFPMEKVRAFDADENGNLYAAALGSNIIEVYDNNANQTEIRETDNPDIIAVEYSEKGIYTLSGKAIYLDNEIVYRLPDTRSAVDMEYIDGKMYLVYNDVEQDLSNAPSITFMTSWSGTKVCAVDLETFEVTEADCDYPLMISGFNGVLWIYAVDDDGVYITDGSKKIYTNTGNIYSFCVIRDDGSFLRDGISEYSTGTISFYDASTGSEADLMPNAGSLYSGGTVYCGGYIYYINNSVYTQNPEKVERIKESVYMKNTVPIAAATLNNAHFSPFGCGRAVITEKKPDDEFALSVLSQDRDYDICILSTADDISRNIRDKGSFYALNDVKGVSEYIDGLFPALKEAAINEDGEIWMLPISMNVYCLLCDPDRKSELPQILSVENVREFCELSYKNDPDRLDISIDSFTLSRMLVQNLLIDNSDLLSDDFRSEIEKIKLIRNSPCFGGDVYVPANNLILLNDGSDMLLMLSGSRGIQQQLISAGAEALPFAGVEKTAECSFICVNPASKHLKETIAYISDLCAYMGNRQNSFMLSDIDKYSEESSVRSLYEVYKNAELFFTIPDDVFYNDFFNYCRDDTEYSVFIKEADRKIEMYLNE